MEYRGPLINWKEILFIIGANIYVFFNKPEGSANQIMSHLFATLFFYFVLGDSKNYFVLLNDRLFVKNPLRPFYKLEIHLKEIHFVDDAMIQYGYALALATNDNPGMRIECTNLTSMKRDQLVKDLLNAINRSK